MKDRASACQLLCWLREQRGWSWADQARALHVVAERLSVSAVTSTQFISLQRTIARWESAESHTVPGQRYQLLLAHRYARSAAGELALGADSDLDTLLTALVYLGVTVEHVCELRDLVIRSTNADNNQPLVLLAGPMRRLAVRRSASPDSSIPS